MGVSYEEQKKGCGGKDSQKTKLDSEVVMDDESGEWTEEEVTFMGRGELETERFMVDEAKPDIYFRGEVKHTERNDQLLHNAM